MQPTTTRNNVKIFGNGSQPMIFAHGFGCDQNMWRYITPAFKENYKIVVFDYVGSGMSDKQAYNKERYSNLNGYALDVLEIMQEYDFKKAIFIGHSVSCMIGLLAAIREPERFEKMVFIGPSPKYINEPPDYVGGFEKKDIEQLLDTMEKNYIGWANFLAPVVMKNSDHPELTEELTQSFCSTDPVIARQFAEVTFLSDNRVDLPKLKVPSLIMQCSDDLIAPFEVGSYASKHLQNSSFELLKATGHCPHMSEPEETIRVIKDYLSRSNNQNGTSSN